MNENNPKDDALGREDSRLSGRVRRYAKVGGSVGGLAAQVVFSPEFSASASTKPLIPPI